MSALGAADPEDPMDLKKLAPGEILTAICGVLLLIVSFFPWYGIDLGPLGDFNRNGWQEPDAFFSIVAVILGVILAAHVIAEKLAGLNLPERLGSVGWGMAHMIGGVVAFVFVLLKWLMNTDFTKFGLYAGLILTAGLAIGGFLMAKEAGELPSSLGGAAGGPTPPRP
jgi:hypothetical protein